VLATAALPQVATAGCLCAEITNVRVGDLKVENATVRAQTWKVSNNSAELELGLAGASAKSSFEILAVGVLSAEQANLMEFAKLNRDPGDDPQAKATLAGADLQGAVSRQTSGDFQTVRVKWQLPASTSGDVIIKVAWPYPAGGADELPDASKSRIKEFCIDGGTRKAMKKKVHGYHRVDFVLSADMASKMTLQIARDTFPISLCADGVKKLGKDLFQIVGREKLKDRDGVLPILYSASI
jgi:hypothetical protein